MHQLRHWVNLVEALSLPPAKLYHATLKVHVPDILKHGLVPQKGAYQRNVEPDNPDLIFAADEKGREKLLSVLAYQIGQATGKAFHEVTGADMCELGAIVVIDDPSAFQRAEKRSKPHSVLEPRDYYASETVPVQNVLLGDQIKTFLRGQWRKLPT